MHALIWGQKRQLHRVWSGEQTSLWQILLTQPFCLLELTAFFQARSLTCPITSSENTVFPYRKVKTEQPLQLAIHTHCPQHLHAPYNPCTRAEGGHSSVHSSLVKTHAAVGAGETEELQEDRELTLLLPCACSHKEEKKREREIC